MKIIGIAILLVMAIIFFLFFLSKSRLPKIGEIAPASKLKQKYNLTAENRPIIKIDPEKVPTNLRGLVPMAEKWGIGDDIIRNDFEEKASDTEKEELKNKLTGRTNEINAWLDSFKSRGMSEEAACFMYMLEALAEMHLWPDK